MRKPALSCTLAVLLVALPANAAAEPSEAAGRASATVVAPLQATSLDDLSFGALTVGPSSGGEVSVAANGSAAAYSGAVAPACGSAGECRPHVARFAVSGEADRTYRVQLPTQVVASGARTGQILDVSRLSVRSLNRPAMAGRGLLDNSGKDEFWIGGVLAVPPATRPDSFRAELVVSVFYD